MPEAKYFLPFTNRLNMLGVRYATSGSVAMIAYGEPRLTNDIDLVALLDRDQIQRLPEAFPPSEFYCPPVEVMLLEAARDLGGQFNIIHHQSGFKADLYLSGRDPLNAWALAKARRFDLDEAYFMVAPPEYVILRKLEYFRSGGSEKHLRDISSILRVTLELPDRAELERQIAARGLQEAWQRAQQVEM